MATIRLVPASGPPIEVESDKTAMVGRDASADVVVNDSSVSRKHARLERWGSNWAVVDQRSANGTFLDGQRVTESVLRDGQELRFGKVAYRVEIKEADFGATMLMSSGASEATVMQPAAPAAAPAPRPAAPRPVAAPPAPRPVPPPPAAVPPPYVPPQPEPAPEGRGPLFWISLVFAALVVLAVAGFLAVMGPGFIKSRAPVEAARAQLKDIAGGDLDAAYARNASSYQSAHPASAFAAFVERHPGLKRNTDSSFNTRTVDDAKAKLSGTVSHAGGTETVVYDLVKEGDAWKVADLEVDGEEAPVAPAPVGGAPAGSGLIVETIAINKTRQGATFTVKIDTRVKGFDLRPEGSVFRVELAEDLETFGADGKRIDELSRVGLETYNQTTASAAAATATFNTSLTFAQPDPGRYRAVITIRDLVGLKSEKHEVPFDLP
jgi:hypothetical protein